MKTRALLLFLLPAVMLSCQQESGTERGSATGISADSTLVNVNEALYDATLTRTTTTETRDVKGTSEGPTVWERMGSLAFVLTELYGSPVEIEGNPYEGNTFSLEVAWRNDTSLDEIREDVARHVRDALGYSVLAATRTRPEYRLSITDPSRLLTASDTEFVSQGTRSAVSIGEGTWRIYGDLEKLAEVFRQETDSMFVAAPEQDSTAYYYEFTDAENFEGLVRQMRSTYGLTVSVQPVEVTYRTIRFSDRE